MTMFQVLAEVVGPVELLGLITLSKLVNVVQVLSSNVPLRRVLKLFATVAADVGAISR